MLIIFVMNRYLALMLMDSLKEFHGALISFEEAFLGVVGRLVHSVGLKYYESFTVPYKLIVNTRRRWVNFLLSK